MPTLGNGAVPITDVSGDNDGIRCLKRGLLWEF